MKKKSKKKEKKSKKIKKIKLKIFGSGWKPDPITFNLATSQTQHLLDLESGSKSYSALVESDLSLAAKLDPTTFGIENRMK